ncbi:hypothetical protein FEM48_Zijuj01G0036200 [Ziziphus jujuba var. spinosa]|uniref:Uncharacterized protein n=1 Tax=Ziziphus jujuba var. spinosa TaxID=714518 RepID=A0A978VYX8_ZIZJJ|nr:hypothetical protein FEM48_Zijuj01G0036200 [Ziziphus jujuba var. spinosa]
MIGNMGLQSDDKAASETILENVWANFIGGVGHNIEETRNTNASSESSKPWEELPYLDGADGSMEILQRLPSLGRWISMGAETWEELLDTTNIPAATNMEQKQIVKASELDIISNDFIVSNPRKRASRELEEDEFTCTTGQPAMKRKASIGDFFDVFEFQDLGTDYLESLLSSL